MIRGDSGFPKMERSGGVSMLILPRLRLASFLAAVHQLLIFLLAWAIGRTCPAEVTTSMPCKPRPSNLVFFVRILSAGHAQPTHGSAISHILTSFSLLQIWSGALSWQDQIPCGHRRIYSARHGGLLSGAPLILLL